MNTLDFETTFKATFLLLTICGGQLYDFFEDKMEETSLVYDDGDEQKAIEMLNFIQSAIIRISEQ
jgi:hypothetical protein